jgi:hypothetical protein
VLRAGQLGFLIPDVDNIFLFSIALRLALGPNQTPTQFVPVALSLWAKRQGREADYPPPYSAEVKKGGPIPHLPHMS